MPVSGSNGYRSGIVTLPNRVRLREMDSRLGMYPTINRLGDKDRRGNFSVVPFDDRETQTFTGNKNISYYSLSKDNTFYEQNDLGLKYTASSNLKLWIDFPYAAPVDLAGAATDISSISYTNQSYRVLNSESFLKTNLTASHLGSPITLIGENRYNVTRFSDNGAFNGFIGFSSKPNTTTFGDGTDDSPFSISVWFRADIKSTSLFDAGEYIFSKGDSSSEIEYFANIKYHDNGSSGQVRFFLRDESTNKYARRYANIATSAALALELIQGKWNHFVFTYNGVGGNAAHEGMNIYFNGSLLPDSGNSNTDSTYVAMEPVADFLRIGEYYDGTREMDAYMAQFALWNKELSADEVKSVFRLTTEKFPQNRVRYGMNTLSGSTSHLNAFATPHEDTPTGIYGYGGTHQGITDSTHMTDYKDLSNRSLVSSENLSFFDDSRINLKTDAFYLTGTDEQVYPGFSSRLADKTQIQIDLSCNEETTFGFTEQSDKWHELGNSSRLTSTNDLSDIRQQLMVYYNKVNKRWEKIARGYGPNTFPTASSGHSAGSPQTTFDVFTELGKHVDRAAIGFSPCPVAVATGSSSPRDTYDEVAIKTMGKPTSNFSFPNHGKFHATSSQTIKMSDYIDRPFLLEKLSLKFNSKMEFSSPSHAGRYMFTLSYIGGGGGATDFLNNDGAYIMPTFFIMRQKKQIKQKTFKRDFRLGTIDPDINWFFSPNSWVGNRNRYSSFASNLTSDDFLNFTLPGMFYLSSGSDETTYVDTDRELVTFGQIGYFASRSITLNRDLYGKLPGDKKINIVNNKITYAETLAGDTWSGIASTQIPPLTGSYIFDFPSRVIPSLPPRNGEYIVYYTGSTSGEKGFTSMVHQWDGGRSAPLDNTRVLSRLGSANESKKLLPNMLIANEQICERALVAGAPSFKLGPRVLQKSQFDDSDRPFEFSYPTLETLDVDSPYLLLPEDELIFGWQYPYGENFNNQQPNILNTSFKNTMTLFGESTLTMFGSQVKNNKEFHDTLNQPLTSEAVHEALHYDNPVIDQYIIATREEYSGSYLDNFATGSVGAGVRSLVGSAENVLSGSFQRFVKCNNVKDRYYDSMQPDLIDLISTSNNSGENIGSYLDSGVGLQINLVSNSEAFFKHLGVYKYNLERSKNPYIFDTNAIIPIKGIFNYRPYNKTLASGNSGVTTAIDTQVVSLNTIPLKRKDYAYTTFGFGSGPQGSFTRVIDFVIESIVVERPRGWKYGIWNAFKETPCVIYRPDRFTGQYADIIQQQYDTRFFNEKTNTLSDPPVVIKFVLPDDEKEAYLVLDENEATVNTFESSNISIYATSSLPYFDDGTSPRNRSYNNLANRVIEIEV